MVVVVEVSLCWLLRIDEDDAGAGTQKGLLFNELSGGKKVFWNVQSRERG